MKAKPWDDLRNTWRAIEWTDDRFESSIKALGIVTKGGIKMIELHYKVYLWRHLAIAGWTVAIINTAILIWRT